MLHYLENMFWGIFLILLPFMSFNRWYGIQLNPQCMGIDLKYVIWFSFFLGIFFCVNEYKSYYIAMNLSFVMTSILHIQWFSIFPVTHGLGLFSFLAHLAIGMLFYVLNQFIITFQFIPLSTSWVGWLNLSGILIITRQINILGYWWTSWHNLIWHCYNF